MRTLSMTAAGCAGALVLGLVSAVTVQAVVRYRAHGCEYQVDSSRRHVEARCDAEFGYPYYRVAASCAERPESPRRSLVLGSQTPVGSPSVAGCPTGKVVTGEQTNGVWSDHVGFKGVR